MNYRKFLHLAQNLCSCEKSAPPCNWGFVCLFGCFFAFLNVYKYLMLSNFRHFFYNFLFLADTLKFAFFPLWSMYNLKQPGGSLFILFHVYVWHVLHSCFRCLKLQAGIIDLQACTTMVKSGLYLCMFGHLSMVLKSFESLLDLETHKKVSLFKWDINLLLWCSGFLRLLIVYEFSRKSHLMLTLGL